MSPLCESFLRADQIDARESFYPLHVRICDECLLVQLPAYVPGEEIFSDYAYFSSYSDSYVEHQRQYANRMIDELALTQDSLVTEVASNDGYLLQHFVAKGIPVLGVEPAANIVEVARGKGIRTENCFLTPETAASLVEQYGKADLVAANNVYAHIPDIVEVTEGVRDLLKDDGVFIFEVHYLGKITQGMQYDMIYHEHLYYYSLIALINHFERCGMTVFDVKPVQIHAGSMRYFVCRKSSRRAKAISPRVTALRNDELAHGFHRAETFIRFAQDIAQRKERLMDLLGRLRAGGRTIAGYGASGRANTIIQYCGIGREHLECIIDDAPAKWDYYTPGSHFPIRSNEVLKSAPPDYLLIFAWGYFSEIAERCRDYLEAGGRMIVPLPDVRLILHPLPGMAL